MSLHKNLLNIRGSIVAIVTPMNVDGSLDFESLDKLIEWHIQQGTNGIVIAGTTGESPTVTVEEQCQLIESTVKKVAGRIPVIAGSGGNSTEEAIALTKEAKQLGADASLQIVPYYNKPTQEGMYQHFKKIAQTVDLPILLYNAPGRTVADLSNETVLRLTSVPNIIGIKDATGNLVRGLELIHKAPTDFLIFSGDDFTAFAYILLGACGNISVTANVVPNKMSKLCDAALNGNVTQTRQLQCELLELNDALFIESNPIPVKWVLQHLGKIKEGIRLPLTELNQSYHEKMRDIVNHLLKE